VSMRDERPAAGGRSRRLKLRAGRTFGLEVRLGAALTT